MTGNILVFNNRPFSFTLFSSGVGALNSDERTHRTLSTLSMMCVGDVTLSSCLPIHGIWIKSVTHGKKCIQYAGVRRSISAAMIGSRKRGETL